MILNEWDFGHSLVSACHAAKSGSMAYILPAGSTRACMSVHPPNTQRHTNIHTHTHTNQMRQLWATAKDVSKNLQLLQRASYDFELIGGYWSIKTEPVAFSEHM